MGSGSARSNAIDETPAGTPRSDAIDETPSAKPQSKATSSNNGAVTSAQQKTLRFAPGS